MEQTKILKNDYVNELTKRCNSYKCPFERKTCPLNIVDCDDVTTEDWYNALEKRDSDYFIYNSIKF